MGLLVDGEWRDKWYDTDDSDGEFVRPDTQFHNWVKDDPGADFPAEPNRYHLYVSWACPWAHRTLIFRKLKGLEDIIGLSVVHWFMGEHGWTFEEDEDTRPPLHNEQYLHEVYTRAESEFSGRVTVPVLWDKKTETIVNNESSEIIRIFNTAFNQWGNADLDFYPEALRDEIDEINASVYDHVNNGVYKCGFATTQDAYEKAFDALFDTLDSLENRLSQQRFLVGDRITEADWRLFTTLIRFEPVYHYHFKCNKKRLRDYPNLWNYTLDLYQRPGIAETTNFHHIKSHYFGSHETINPHRIVPKGPDIDFTVPHNRDRFD